MPVSSVDIAGANALDAERKVEALEKRVEALEERLLELASAVHELNPGLWLSFTGTSQKMPTAQMVKAAQDAAKDFGAVPARSLSSYDIERIWEAMAGKVEPAPTISAEDLEALKINVRMARNHFGNPAINAAATLELIADRLEHMAQILNIEEPG